MLWSVETGKRGYVLWMAPWISGFKIASHSKVNEGSGYQALSWCSGWRTSGSREDQRKNLSACLPWQWNGKRCWHLHCHTNWKCSVNKRSRNPCAPLPNFQAGYPGDRVHLDMLGPFCESLQGHKYVLMIVDQFTPCLEMAPLTVQDAESVARVFF